jgi:hypothetical protein
MTAAIPLPQLLLMAVWVAMLHVNVFPPRRPAAVIEYGEYERIR